MRTARLSSALPVSFLLLGALALAPAAGTQQPTVRPAPPNLLAKFDVSAGTVQLLQPQAAANGDQAVPVMIAGELRTLALQPYDLRTPNFQLLVQDATGIHPQPTPPCITYRGILLEEPETKVAASVVNGSVNAIVHRPGIRPGDPGQNWVVQPVRDVDPTAGAAAHVVFRASDTLPLPYTCGNAQVPLPARPAPDAVGYDVTLSCDFAIEADIEFYQLNGSNVTATQNDINTVMNQVEFIYDRDCDIQYNITTIIVTTTAVYSSDDPGTLLSQFAARWNSVHAGVLRDLAHLFTGRNLTGTTIGIAQLSSVCNLGVAYGLSQSRFSTNFNSRVGLTCHEVGHGWSAQHCDAVSPCYIMCAGLGGCSGNVTLFGPSEIAQITAFAASRTCLSVVPTTPVIQSLTPLNVTVFSPGNVTLSGSGFTGVTSFRVGTTTYTSGFSVVNDGSMVITLPQGTALGLTTVAVTSPLGTSNAYPIIYIATSPPKLKNTASVPPTGGIVSIDWAGTPGRLWFLLLGIFNNTTPFQGFPLLDPHLILTTGVFAGPLGITNLTVPVPGGLGFGILYLQVLEANPTQPIATGTSSITVLILL
ncbi:MAG: M12 family metallo-peptidase [Planctomycetota bacterium]